MPDIDTLQLVAVRRPFFEDEIRSLERENVSCTVLPVPGSEGRTPLAYARFQAGIWRQTVGSEYDLVHAHYGLVGPSALAQPRRPVVITLWGSELHTRFRPLIEAATARADAVIVVSERIAEMLDQPCHVIPHGIDTDLFRPMPTEEAKAEVGWDPDKKHVIFPYDPGRSLKNYPLAESVVETVDDDLDVQVELHAVYGVPHERFPTYLNASDALLLTSDHEGSPNAVKEALACNLPVVGLDVGDVPELLAGVRNCHVCGSETELARRLAEVLDSGERADARERIEELSLERTGQKIRAVYESVLDGSADAEETRFDEVASSYTP